MPFRTERLLLRPWREADADALFRIASDPRVAADGGWVPHASPEHSLRVIRDVFFDPWARAIELRETGQLIGCVSLQLGELGFWLGSEFHGKGYATEACRGFLKQVFKELRPELVACTNIRGNRGSVAVQRKLGFDCRHVRTHRMTDENGVEQWVETRILRHIDWEK